MKIAKRVQEPLPDLFSPVEWCALLDHFGLAPRQGEVARWICRGRSNPAIADEMGVSLDTVRMHTKSVFRKMKITDRVGVPVRFVLALRHMLASPSKEAV